MDIATDEPTTIELKREIVALRVALAALVATLKLKQYPAILEAAAGDWSNVTVVNELRALAEEANAALAAPEAAQPN